MLIGEGSQRGKRENPKISGGTMTELMGSQEKNFLLGSSTSDSGNSRCGGW